MLNTRHLIVNILTVFTATAAPGFCAEETKVPPPVFPAGIENFEAGAVPSGWMGSDGSDLESTAERFKSGEKSLLWTWTKREALLTCAWPAGFAGVQVPYSNAWYPGHTLAFWVYNETPMPKVRK